jgi:hypothetical protein
MIRFYAIYQNLTDVDGGHKDTTPQATRGYLIQADGTVLGNRFPEKDGDEIGHIEEEPVQGDARHPAEVDTQPEQDIQEQEIDNYNIYGYPFQVFGNLSIHGLFLVFCKD